MSYLNDYYCFGKVAMISKTRLDCVVSTKSYPELEEKRATRATKASDKRDATNIDDLVIYLGDVPEHFGKNKKRKADKSITIKGKNLSSVFFPDPTNNYGYGDVEGTTDALLFIFEDLQIVDGCIISGELEIFVARGKSRNREGLYNLLCDGVLDDEMNELRAKAHEMQAEKHL